MKAPSEQNPNPDAKNDPEAAEAAEAVVIAEPQPDAPEIPPQDAAPAAAAIVPKRPSHPALMLLLGGAAAAALGAAATLYLLPTLPAAWQPGAAQLRAAIAGQAALISAQGAEIAALRADIPAMPDLAPLREALASSDARLAVLEQRPVVQPADSAELAALRADIEALRARLAQNASASQISSAEIEAAAANAAARIAAAEAEAAELRARSEAEAQRALAQAAVAHLRAALENGSPMDAALAQLQAAGIAAPPALAGSVPSLQALRDDFAPAARRALARARTAAPDQGTLDRLGAFVLAQTGARSLQPREGGDADAVLSRAEAALRRADLAAALAEVASLPEPVLAEMADWQAAAARRQAATQALADLAQGVN